LLLLQIAKIRIPAKAENIVKIMIGWFIFDICISYLFYFDLLDIGFVHFLCINQSSLLSICMDLTSNKEDIQVVDICYKI